MTAQEIVAKVRELNLPANSYVVFGSCPLAAVGIREANDVDLYVTPAVLETLKQQGWQQVHKGPGDEPYTHDVYEAHDNWNFSPYAPSLEQLQTTAMVIDGVPFASLQEVRKWKLASGGEKHIADVTSIDQYVANQKEQYVMASPKVEAVAAVWKAYTDGLEDWQALVQGIEPKATDCGPVYEVTNPIDRPGESLAIADMREVTITGPHYHRGGETEIYIVLTGTGSVIVGGQETELTPGTVSITEPGTAHFTVPGENLVLAVINTPSFNPANAVSIDETVSDPSVGFDAGQYANLKAATR